MIEDNQHTIWIATENGLSAILTSQQIFRVLDNGYHGQVMQMVRKIRSYTSQAGMETD